LLSAIVIGQAAQYIISQALDEP